MPQSKDRRPMDTGTPEWISTRGEEASPGNPASIARALLALGVSLEIAASEPQANDGSRVGPGEPIPHFGAGDRVRFRWLGEPPSTFRTGDWVNLELDDMTTTFARILSLDDTEVEVGTRIALARPVPGGQIVSDARWIQRSLRHSLLSSMNGRHDRLALNLMGIREAPRPTRGSPVPEDVRGLNSEQAEVVSQGLRSGVTFVLGPPGTGKTRALSALMAAAIQSGKTVACVAPSNLATDRLLDELCRTLANRGVLSEGTVIRTGRIRLEPVQPDWGWAVDPWAIALDRFGASDDPAMIRAEHDRLVERCMVLVTTAARTHLTPLRRRFDLVVVDEAAAAPLPLIYHVATLAKNHGSLVVCGDPCQLPVVTRSRHQHSRHYYGLDPFRARGIRAGQEHPEGAAVIMLKTQYRYHPDIANLVSGPMYGGKLRSHESVLGRPDLGWPMSGGSLALLDTSKLSGSARRIRKYGNALHAEAIAALIRHMRTVLCDPAVEIAVLARYRDQVASIHRCLRPESYTKVSTVHAMQGSEADIVVLDLSACPAHDHLGDYLQDPAPHGVGARLLNTAITRARQRLVIVADLPYILNHPQVPENAMARSVLNRFRRSAYVISPQDLG